MPLQQSSRISAGGPVGAEAGEAVVLVDDAGRPVGVAAKDRIHSASTPLHLAFSCHLLRADGRVLVTRRALTKLTWPGVWTNSFCGHPGPGESFEDAVARRARQELGVRVHDVRVVLPDFRYRATDASGVVENEICPVFLARTDEGVRPDPAEVMDHVWAEPLELGRAVGVAPWALSPWLVEHAPQLSFLQEGTPS